MMMLRVRSKRACAENTSQRAAQDELSIFEYVLIDSASSKASALTACAFDIGSTYHRLFRADTRRASEVQRQRNIRKFRLRVECAADQETLKAFQRGIDESVMHRTTKLWRGKQPDIEG